MMTDYLKTNQKSWDAKVASHYESAFYNVDGFIKGQTSLNEIELPLLGNISGLKVLHLQCHFGQDSISLARMGADVTAVDFSNEALKKGEELCGLTGQKVRFVHSDIYSLPQKLEGSGAYDLVFTSYGTIGWLPDLEKWSNVIAHYLKPGGHLVFAEFHPVLWMFDDDFEGVAYKYSKSDPIIEQLEGSYADPKSNNVYEHISWNHGLGEVFSALHKAGMIIEYFEEFDYSPYDAFRHSEEYEKGKFRVKKFGNKIPLVYALKAKLEL
ncbi:MAG: class I SAM-dependent methyltransferase [Flavobacteriales bacterium]|nr:class I SAM-dependent methyltransferase [Flavobacteriales bacterium]